MGLVVGAALLAIGVMLFLLIPILRGEWASFERTDEDPTEVGARKHVALRGLRDAEYDYRAGKLDEDDYRQIKAEMSREALDAMEAATAETDQAQPSGAPDQAEDPIEAEILRTRRGLADGTTCHDCGRVNQQGSRFCAGCGSPLRVAASSAHPAGS